MFTVQESKDDKIVSLLLEGELTTVTCSELDGHFNRLLETGERRFVVDFEKLTLITSAGLRVFLAFAKKLKKNQGAMALCQMAPGVFEVFEMTGFTSILTICPTAEDAAEKVQGDA